MKRKRKKQLVKVHTVLFFALCGIIGLLLGISIVDAFGKELLWWELGGKILEGLFLLSLAFFLQIIFHEAGHMLAGLVRGWSFISFMVLGFVLTRREGRFYWSRFAIPGVGGQCLMAPPEKRDTDFGIALYNAGGVLANLLVVLLSGVFLLMCYRECPWAMTIFGVSLVIAGLFFAAINGIPACHNGIPNDGKNIEELRKDAFATLVFLTTMKVIGRLQQGCPVEEAMEGYISKGRKLDYSNPIHVMAVNFDLSYAIAKLDFDMAYSILDRMTPEERKIISLYRNEILLEKVFLNLVVPHDGVDVGVLIDSDALRYFEMQTAFRPTALRVKYAFARLYEYNEVKAAVIYEQFQKVCKRYHVPGEVLTEKRLMDYVRSLTPSEE